jgi:hypothetical protein
MPDMWANGIHSWAPSYGGHHEITWLAVSLNAGQTRNAA